VVVGKGGGQSYRAIVHPTFAASIPPAGGKGLGTRWHLSLPKGREGKMARGGIDEGRTGPQMELRGAPVSGAAVGIPTTALAGAKAPSGAASL